MILIVYVVYKKISYHHKFELTLNRRKTRIHPNF